MNFWIFWLEIKSDFSFKRKVGGVTDLGGSRGCCPRQPLNDFSPYLLQIPL